MKTIVITGVTGQLGSYLSELYLKAGDKVYGLRRRSSTLNTSRIDHIYKDPHVSDKLELVYGDLADDASIIKLVSDIKPDVFINAGAQSHVRVSFENPIYTMDITGTGVMRCLDAIKNYSPKTRFVQCSSSEMMGSSPPPQNEQTPFRPRSPYAVAKVAGYYAVTNYREAYNLFASNAIMFNYEGKERGETFVTRKITRAATRIKLGLQNKLYLGNIKAKRDWSNCSDTADAVMRIANADRPDDFVVATGEMHSVEEFLQLVFHKLDLDWKQYVEIDERYFRPTEVDALCGDSSKIRRELNWAPKHNLESLVNEMVANDLILAQNELLIMEKK